MTKRIALALVLVFGAAGAVNAQSVTASARVPQIVAFTGTQQGLIFPEAAPGTGSGSVVDGSMTAASATGQLGYNDVRLNYSTPTIAVPNTVTLTSVDAGDSFAATVFCAVDDQAASSVTLGDCSTGTTLGHTGPGVETRRVFVGGVITQAAIDTAMPALDYTGTITLVIAP